MAMTCTPLYPHPHSTSGVPLDLRGLGAIWAISGGGSQAGQPSALPPTESRLRDWGRKTTVNTYTFKMNDEVTQSSDA